MTTYCSGLLKSFKDKARFPDNNVSCKVTFRVEKLSRQAVPDLQYKTIEYKITNIAHNKLFGSFGSC